MKLKLFEAVFLMFCYLSGGKSPSTVCGVGNDYRYGKRVFLTREMDCLKGLLGLR